MLYCHSHLTKLNLLIDKLMCRIIVSLSSAGECNQVYLQQNVLCMVLQVLCFGLKWLIHHNDMLKILYFISLITERSDPMNASLTLGNEVWRKTLKLVIAFNSGQICYNSIHLLKVAEIVKWWLHAQEMNRKQMCSYGML